MIALVQNLVLFQFWASSFSVVQQVTAEPALFLKSPQLTPQQLSEPAFPWTVLQLGGWKEKQLG